MDNANLKKAVNVAKKNALQSRIATKKRHASLENGFGNKFEFLDAEATLAVWFEVNKKGLWNPNYPYSNFESYNVKKDFTDYLTHFSGKFENIKNFFGFCFPLDWAVTGAIILELDELMNNLDFYMFDFDDEMRFFSPDFNKAIILEGERSGSGDKLNELSVSVLGAEWIGMWEKGPKKL